MKNLSKESITAYFETDHDRLENIFQKFQQDKRTDFAKAKDSFRKFKQGLRRHIQWEEKILFPLFELKTGMREQGPTSVMKMEHQKIEQELEAVHGKVRVGDPDSDEEEKQLLQTLAQHNEKEENVLYPMIDRLVDDEERKDIFLQMEKVPVHDGSPCCCTSD